MPKHATEPPNPPSVSPRLRMRPSELVGLVILLALPTIAVLGEFGPTMQTAVGENASLHLEVEYPARSRFRLNHTVVARVTNRGASTLPAVIVVFDESYVRSFSDVSFTPSPIRAYEVDVGDLARGETRIVSMEVRANHYGSSEGQVSAVAAGQRLAVKLATFTFP